MSDYSAICLAFKHGVRDAVSIAVGVVYPGRAVLADNHGYLHGTRLREAYKLGFDFVASTRDIEIDENGIVTQIVELPWKKVA